MSQHMELNDYSKSILKGLLKHFPQFNEHLCITPSSGDFTIEFPNPSETLLLSVSTNNETITIGVDEWHYHIDLFGDMTTDQQLDEACSLISAIIESKVNIISFYEGGKRTSSWLTDDVQNELQSKDEGEDWKILVWSTLEN